MMLNRCRKASPETGIRTVPPEETVRRAIPLLKEAGMDMPEDITPKDNLGIPVFSLRRAVTAKGTEGFYNGKGATREQALASAVMEAIERHSAEMCPDDEVVYGTYEQAADNGLAVNPYELNLPPSVAGMVRGAEIAWTEGYELFRGCPVWVPACEAFYPYKPTTDLQLYRFHTNGLAAGNTLEEAILHGLFELIERDAWSIAEFNEYANADVEIDEPGTEAARLLEMFADAGIEIHLKDLTSDIGIPTIGAAADDVRTKDPEMLVIGVGTHLDPEIACVRALTEVAQSRTTHKHGAKINARLQKQVQDMGYEAMKRANRMWFSPSGKTVRLSEIPNRASEYVLDDIETVLGALMDRGFDMVVCKDLTRPEFGVPVVRMTVPGLEVSTMDPDREGNRLYGSERLHGAPPGL